MAHWPVYFGRGKVELGLERTLALLDAVGNPHHHLPPVIHVAGTNGKGSTCAFIRQILKESGYDVHGYISPHLIQFNERILLNCSEILDSQLYDVLEECRIAAEKYKLDVTFFEGTTVAAFLAFSRAKADFLVLETGMGGRLDATNTISQPILTAITPISYDHTEYLGEKIEQIAFEKAGIIKNNVPVVISPQLDEAFSVLEAKANLCNSEILAYEYDYAIEKTENGFIFKHKNGEHHFPTPSLIGDHQLINASTAVAACLQLKKIGYDNITIGSIASGITKTKWIGRLEQITPVYLADYLDRGASLYVDGAHNQSGAQVIAEYIREKNCSTYLIVGLTKGRDIESFLKHFQGLTKLVIGIRIDVEPSSYTAAEICNTAEQLGFETVAAESLEDAFLLVQKHARAHNNERYDIYACGSLYLCGWIIATNKGIKL